MKKLFALCLALGAVMTVSAVDFSFLTSMPKGWTSNPDPYGFESTGSARGAQYTSSATLTLTGATEVTEVKIVAASNIAGKNTIAVKVGNTTFGSTETLAKAADQNFTFAGSKTNGDVVISITRSEKSIYIKTVSITGKVVVGQDTMQLDTTYVYDEPTTVEPFDSIGSNKAYAFINNNIYINVTQGARYNEYFSCNAGATMTIAASKPIKGITIDGLIKKNFDVDASSGDVEYMDASEDEVEGTPVLIIKNVNEDTLILTCEKQMRVYALNVYFDANPTDSIGGGGGDDDYTFDYEPTTPTNILIVFGDSIDMEYDETYAGFDIAMWNDDYELSMFLYSNTTDDQTIIPVGNYAINDTYTSGTVQASPGGDEWYDYPTVLMTDFEYDTEYQDWYYNTAYYIQAGTVTVERDNDKVNIYVAATSHYGSTITLGASWNVTESTGWQEVKAEKAVSKSLRNGRLIIRRNDKNYNTLGAELR